MAEQDEEVMGAASPAPSDHKRKHEDLEPDAPEPPQLAAGLNGNSDSESLKKAEGEEEDDSEAKRPRLEDKLDVPGITLLGLLFAKMIDGYDYLKKNKNG